MLKEESLFSINMSEPVAAPSAPPPAALPGDLMMPTPAMPSPAPDTGRSREYQFGMFVFL